MKYTITFACGHTCKIDLFGKKETRDWIAKQKENELCPECYAEERKKEKLKMQQKNLEDGMPMLSGSEKQVLWAEEIRRDFLKKFDRVLEELHEGFDKDPQLAQAWTQDCVLKVGDTVRSVSCAITGYDPAKAWVKVPALGGWVPLADVTEASDTRDGKNDNYLANLNARVWLNDAKVVKIINNDTVQLDKGYQVKTGPLMALR